LHPIILWLFSDVTNLYLIIIKRLNLFIYSKNPLKRFFARNYIVIRKKAHDYQYFLQYSRQNQLDQYNHT
jgi:hypothetical protein